MFFKFFSNRFWNLCWKREIASKNAVFLKLCEKVWNLFVPPGVKSKIQPTLFTLESCLDYVILAADLLWLKNVSPIKMQPYNHKYIKLQFEGCFSSNKNLNPLILKPLMFDLNIKDEKTLNLF